MRRRFSIALIVLNLAGCAAVPPRETGTTEQVSAAPGLQVKTPERLLPPQTPPPALTPFRVELQEATDTPRGPAVEGYLYNHLSWRIGNVRLRVESLDPTGKVTGEAAGWVLGDAPAGGRAYFFIPVSERGATYRGTVDSFDRISIEGP
jgi:hypothetical protein